MIKKRVFMLLAYQYLSKKSISMLNCFFIKPHLYSVVVPLTRVLEQVFFSLYIKSATRKQAIIIINPIKISFILLLLPYLNNALAVLSIWQV